MSQFDLRRPQKTSMPLSCRYLLKGFPGLPVKAGRFVGLGRCQTPWCCWRSSSRWGVGSFGFLGDFPRAPPSKPPPDVHATSTSWATLLGRNPLAVHATRSSLLGVNFAHCSFSVLVIACTAPCLQETTLMLHSLWLRCGTRPEAQRCSLAEDQPGQGRLRLGWPEPEPPPAASLHPPRLLTRLPEC